MNNSLFSWLLTCPAEFSEVFHVSSILNHYSGWLRKNVSYIFVFLCVIVSYYQHFIPFSTLHNVFFIVHHWLHFLLHIFLHSIILFLVLFRTFFLLHINANSWFCSSLQSSQSQFLPILYLWIVIFKVIINFHSFKNYLVSSDELMKYEEKEHHTLRSFIFHML